MTPGVDRHFVLNLDAGVADQPVPAEMTDVSWPICLQAGADDRAEPSRGEEMPEFFVPAPIRHPLVDVRRLVCKKIARPVVSMPPVESLPRPTQRAKPPENGSVTPS